MLNNNVANKETRVFIYGACSEDRITEMVKDLESKGCTLVQVFAGMMPHPGAKFALNGQAGMVAVYRFLVRAPKAVHDAMISEAKRNAIQN